MISKTPQVPYYAVIFTSSLSNDDPEYHKTAARMVELAQDQDGFLGIESARSELGISVSYWKDLESIQKWRTHYEHVIAKENGRKNWYSSYMTRIALVEKDYGFNL